MSASLNCAITGFFQGRNGILHSCSISKGDSGSPLLVLDGGKFRVVGLHVINANTNTGKVAGVLSVRLFHAKTGDRQAIRAVQRAGAAWSAGHPPQQGGPANPLPLQTIDQLLDGLQLAEAAPPPSTSARRDPAQRTAAIAAFQSQRGLPVTGRATFDLLGSLIQATP